MSLIEQERSGGAGERPLVLVADDEEAVRNALGRNLVWLGCEVLLANDGEQALRAAIDAKPAVVFLDLRMPGMDGHTLLRALPASGVQASVVVMSGQANMDDVIDALRMGAVDFLKKPWSTSDLAAALARGVEVHRAVDASDAPLDGSSSSNAQRLAGGGRAGWPCFDARRERLLERMRSHQVADPLSIDDLVHLVEGDPALGTAILRLANSRFYPQQPPTEYLGAAVSRIGARMLHAVAETLALRDGYPTHARELRALHERIWRFSVVRGLAMRAIADSCGPGAALEPIHCYLTGLLLDVSLVRHHQAPTPPDPGSPLWSASLLARPMAVRVLGYDEPSCPSPPASPELLDRCGYGLGLGDTVLRRLGMTLTDDASTYWEIFT